MDYLKINRMIFLALETLAPIGTAKISMFPVNNPYGHPPFLRFRFKDKSKDDEIYTRIKIAVESFEGNLEWSIYIRPEWANYILTPSFFEELRGEQSIYNVDYFINILGENTYIRKIDEAIADMPALAEVIKHCLDEGDAVVKTKSPL